MTEPITDSDIELAVRTRFDCTYASVTSWRDEHRKKWHGASLTWVPHPHTDTTWPLSGCCESREALLREVEGVKL